MVPGGHPSDYRPVPALLNFCDRVDTDELPPYFVLHVIISTFSSICSRNLLPGKSDKEVFTMVPRLPGKREVIANLHAKQLTGIVGVVEIEVIQK